MGGGKSRALTILSLPELGAVVRHEVLELLHRRLADGTWEPCSSATKWVMGPRVWVIEVFRPILTLLLTLPSLWKEAALS